MIKVEKKLRPYLLKHRYKDTDIKILQCSEKRLLPFI